MFMVVETTTWLCAIPSYVLPSFAIASTVCTVLNSSTLRALPPPLP